MGSGFKDWTAGDVLTAADVDGYLMRQTVMTFADSSARDTALSGVLDEGMLAYLEDTDRLTYYTGSAWVDVSNASSAGVWETFTPNVTSNTGAFGAGTLNYAEYTRVNDLVVARLSYSITTNGQPGPRGLIFDLPVTASSTYAVGDNIGHGRESGTSGDTLQVWVNNASQTEARAVLYNGNTWTADGTEATLVVTYEAN